jgi:predicted dehydrogenase
MKPVKMLVFGSANPHVVGYLSLIREYAPYVEFVAFADEDEARLNRIRGLVGESARLSYYQDLDSMLDAHPEAEAMMVGTDNCDHYACYAKAFQRGLHIYSMKVVSMDEGECQSLLEMQKSSGSIFQVELELHFQPQYRQARELIQSGRLGRIEAIYLSNISQSPICYYPNWGIPELSYGRRVPLYPGANVYRGGALTDHPHPFDLLRWITGAEFATVRAMAGRNQRSYLEVEDHIVVAGKLTDGTKYMINPSYSNLEERLTTRKLLWPKALECHLKITGSDGYYTADYYDNNAVHVLGDNFDTPNRLIVQLNNANRKPSLLGSFAEAVRGLRDRPESTLEDGVAVVKVMNAAYESVYQDCEIVL